MDLRFTSEENAFRDEVRAFFRENVPEAVRQKLVDGEMVSRENYVAWARVLDARGWGAPHWPRKYGGTGWDPMRQYIFLEELQKHPAPQPQLPPHDTHGGATDAHAFGRVDAFHTQVGSEGYHSNPFSTEVGDFLHPGAHGDAHGVPDLHGDAHGGSADVDFDDVDSDSYTARLEHDFAPGVTLRNLSRFSDNHRFAVITSIQNPAAFDPVTGLVTRSRQINERINRNFTNQTNLSFEFQTGALEHSMSTGVEYSDETQIVPGRTGAGGSGLSAA